MGRAARAVGLVAAVLVGAACGEGGAADGGAPLIAATTSIWADITGNVACDGEAVVEPIIPAGADAHSFEPSLADRGRLQDATLIVANGMDLEEGLVGTLESARDDGAVVFTVADHVGPVGERGPGRSVDGDVEPSGPSADDHDDDDHDEHDHDHDHDDVGDDHVHDHDHDHDHDHVHDEDPHLWLDPHLVDRSLDPLARALVDEAGLDADVVAACTQRYRDALAALDADVQALVGELPPEARVLVTAHGSFSHFAERYGFDIVGTVVPSNSSMAEANPAALEALAGTIRETGVAAIFTDVALDDRDARAVADRVGVPVVALHTESLGGPGSGAETYLELLRTNAELIVDALGDGVR